MLVILGMHKSGTTLVSQILHQSGISMGDFDASKGYDEGNQFERASTQAINKSALDCGDDYSIDVRKPLALSRLPAHFEHDAKDLITELGDKHGTYWGFKDPRTCLTYGLWVKVLPPHKRILVYRHPEEVCLRYLKKTPPRWRYFAWVNGIKSHLAWYVYNAEVLKHLQATPDLPNLVLNYAEFMSSSVEFERLEAFVGQSLTDQRKPKMYRNKMRQTLSQRLCTFVCKYVWRADVYALFDSLEALKTEQQRRNQP